MALLQSVWRYFLALTLICCAGTAQSANETLTVTNSKAWKPYSYIDDNGEPAGILIDLWESYGEVNNVDIMFELVDWQPSIDLVRQGQVHIHAGLLRSNVRDQFLEFGTDLLKLDTQLYFHRQLLNFDADVFLQGEHDYQVGVVKGGYEEEYLREHFPNLMLKSFANNENMIKSVLRGELLAFSADLQVANYYLLSGDVKQEFVDVKHLYSGMLYIASSKSNLSILADVSNKFNHISSEEKQRILSRWMHIQTVYPQFLLPVALAFIGLCFGVYAVSLKHNVRKKTDSLTLVNKELKVLSETDALTGLCNRRRFMECLEAYKLSRTTLTVMILDIDDFKLVNDRYGHIKGDLVIQAVAGVIKSVTNDNQIAARIGGEEFAVAYIGEGVGRSQSQVESIVALVRGLRVPEVEFTSISLSAGCAVYKNASDFATLVDADKLMYQAKAQGKNQAVVSVISRCKDDNVYAEIG
ncbi:hypothetical protein BCU70_10420 [Vibrio sp. 10N.286.49.C2]|uniref:sensor domain-containing diguanylate cyclase n=1 Tax=unclassified Vibrio TaxID=2614977 RepID=UPI000C833B86|nr:MULTISPECIES: sensor domain-containing diguanylate cyclase [unclassified Vibrio]PMH25452.1 hypothetical protein BCU70_10420 [Vibrio sp. 10N.286.49.C2]PMH51308.1 hypothetical protein BCU66_17365 [Vibrio sp. 10N.286.49.B1]PMH81596.1 hypothetical protein BCU58_02545 [Vibrio sp. 10N.286.48.B7]